MCWGRLCRRSHPRWSLGLVPSVRAEAPSLSTWNRLSTRITRGLPCKSPQAKSVHTHSQQTQFIQNCELRIMLSIIFIYRKCLLIIVLICLLFIYLFIFLYIFIYCSFYTGGSRSTTTIQGCDPAGGPVWLVQTRRWGGGDGCVHQQLWRLPQHQSGVPGVCHYHHGQPHRQEGQHQCHQRSEC